MKLADQYRQKLIARQAKYREEEKQIREAVAREQEQRLESLVGRFPAAAEKSFSDFCDIDVCEADGLTVAKPYYWSGSPLEKFIVYLKCEGFEVSVNRVHYVSDCDQPSGEYRYYVRASWPLVPSVEREP